MTRFIGVEYDPNALAEDLSARPPLIKAPAPPGVAGGVMRIAANMVAQAKLRRKTQIIQLDEYTQRLVDDRIFTRGIKEDLSLYQRQDPEIGGRRPAAGSIGVTGIIAREHHASPPDVFGDWTKDLRLTSTVQDVIDYWYGGGRI